MPDQFSRIGTSAEPNIQTNLIFVWLASQIHKSKGSVCLCDVYAAAMNSVWIIYESNSYIHLR